MDAFTGSVSKTTVFRRYIVYSMLIYHFPTLAVEDAIAVEEEIA